MRTGRWIERVRGAVEDTATRLVAVLDRPTVRRDIFIVAGLLAIQVGLVGLYFGITDSTITQPRYVLYPLAWIAVGVWAPFRVNRRTSDPRARLVGAAVAFGYFLLVAWIAGLIGFSGGHLHEFQTGLDITLASPGWGPRVSYVTGVGFVTVIPYLLVGYASLSYLVYVTVADMTAAAASGLLGLFACVGCSFSLLASLVAGTAGGSSGIATAVYALSIDISTLVFLFAIGLFVWRPGLST